MLTLPEAKNYFECRLNELNAMCSDGTPWVFLCGSALIEYLSKLAKGDDGGGAGFKEFVTKYMPQRYRDFQYESSDCDLPVQMYHVLRCGIVHSFSLIPDTRAKKHGGRDRSIVLSHTDPHLSCHSSLTAKDACVFNAEQFILDIEQAAKKLFDDAAQDAVLAGNITRWLRKHPPIVGPLP
jgi:hypothetical protein